MTGDLAGAVAAYREALRLDSDQAIEARYSLGVAYAEAGNVLEAVAAIGEAVERDDTRAVSLGLLRAATMARSPNDAIVSIPAHP